MFDAETYLLIQEWEEENDIELAETAHKEYDICSEE